MLFWNKGHGASTKFERNKKTVELHISPTGRVWVDPNEVVRTDAFQKQREAVKRLREAQEKMAASA